MNGSGGHIWLAEALEQAPGGTRVDEFEAATGKYLGRELIEEEGVSSLTEGVAVGDSTGEEEGYVGAHHEGEDVVAVFGSNDKLQGTWSGSHTANKSFTQGGGKMVAALEGVAVDVAGNLQSEGDVYVSTHSTTGSSAFNVVDVLQPEAEAKKVLRSGASREPVKRQTGTAQVRKWSRQRTARQRGVKLRRRRLVIDGTTKNASMMKAKAASTCSYRGPCQASTIPVQNSKARRRAARPS